MLTLVLGAARAVPALAGHADDRCRRRGEHCARSGHQQATKRPPSTRRAKRWRAAKLTSAIARACRRMCAAHPRSLEPARYLGDLYYRASRLRRRRAHVPSDPARLRRTIAKRTTDSAACMPSKTAFPKRSASSRRACRYRRRSSISSTCIASAAISTRSSLRSGSAADEHPNDVGRSWRLGTLYHGMHRNAGSCRRILQRALELAPRSCPALSELGSTYIDLGRFGSAIDMLEALSRASNPTTTRRSSIWATPTSRGTIPTEALAHFFEHANRVRPDGPEAIIDLGYLQDVDGHWQAAVADYLRALAIQPLSVDAYGNLGYDYDAHHLYSLAEAAYLKGLSISPSNGRLHYLLGRTYAEQGQARSRARAVPPRRPQRPAGRRASRQAAAQRASEASARFLQFCDRFDFDAGAARKGGHRDGRARGGRVPKSNCRRLR